jgi:hypothetical protein
LGFADEMKLSPEEIGAVLESGVEVGCYLDPVLERSPRRYAVFLVDLYRSGVIGWTSPPKVLFGVFFVRKKNGKLRLFFDARKAYLLFREPPTTLLGSMESWGRVELPSCKEDLFVAQEDVRDFFYRLGFSRALGELFSLPPPDLELLRTAFGGELPGDLQSLLLDSAAGSPVCPYVKVLPMGFSWAFHLAHEAHMTLALLGAPQADLVMDGTQ